MYETTRVSREQGREWLNAAKQGDLSLLTALFAANQSLLHHQGSGIGHSAMHWCAAKGYIECLQWLVKQGADINNLNAEDSTPLHAAAANGQESIVLYLLDQPNMTLTAVDSSGDTAKQAAESKKWLAIAALIPDQPRPHEPAAALPLPDHNHQPPSQTIHPLSAPFPVRQLDEPQLTPAPEPQPDPSLPSSKDTASDRTASPSGVTASPSGVPSSKNTASDRAASPSSVPSSKDTPPEQSAVCSRGPSQSTSSAAATQESFPSCFTGVGQGIAVSESLPQPDCDPQRVQPPPVEQHAERQKRESDQQSSNCSRFMTSRDAGASSIDEQAPQPCPAKAEGKAWLDAARYGKLHTMKAMMARSKHKAALVAFNGQGTSYGLMGHTALHWAAAKGYSDSVTWLLQQGADANCSNQGGSTPLHSAVSHGQANAMQLLVYMGLADTLAEDECGETPMGLAQSQGHTGLAQTLETAQYVHILRSQPQSGWQMKTVREVLQRSGVDMAALLERQEVITACQQQLDKLPRPVGGCAKVHTSKASSMPAVSTCKANPACGESEDSEQNDTLQHSAEAAKQRGNVLYQQAQFPQAISLYSMAINLHTQFTQYSQDCGGGQKALAVLYSNRSAAFASVHRWDEAADDAEQCIALMPNWSKGHCRVAASLWAHGHKDMAVAAYRRAVALEPTCQPALAGLEKLGAQ